MTLLQGQSVKLKCIFKTGRGRNVPAGTRTRVREILLEDGVIKYKFGFCPETVFTIEEDQIDKLLEYKELTEEEIMKHK